MTAQTRCYATCHEQIVTLFLREELGSFSSKVKENLFLCFSREINSKMNKNIAEDIKSVKESCSARKFDEEANVSNRSTENYHEPLEALRGARIMADEVGVSRA